MGRPLQKKWFTAKDGSIAGDLTVTTATGNEPIINQKGTGKYTVGSGTVKLVNKLINLTEGEAILEHNGENVKKISQYRMYYFNGGSAPWRDKQGNIVGTIEPALTPEGGIPPEPVVEVNTVSTQSNSTASNYRSKSKKTKAKDALRQIQENEQQKASEKTEEKPQDDNAAPEEEN